VSSAVLQQYAADLRSIVRDIQQWAPPQTIISLATVVTPKTYDSGVLMRNAIIRGVATEAGIPLIDWAETVSGLMKYASSYWRGGSLPSSSIAIHHARILFQLGAALSRLLGAGTYAPRGQKCDVCDRFIPSAGPGSGIARAAMLTKGTYTDKEATWYSYDAVINSTTTVPTRASKTNAHVFLIGDSLDRYVVLDACGPRGFVGSKLTTYDPDDVIKYSSSNGSKQCNTRWGSISSLHCLGSKGTQFTTEEYTGVTSGDKLNPTLPRIRKALELYKRANGHHPTYLVIQFNLWEADDYRDVNSIKASLRSYKSNFRAALRLLKSLLPSSTTIAIRTVPPGLKAGPAMLVRNSAMRAIAREQGLPLIDWAEMVSGLSPSLYIRDRSHPTVPFTASFAEKLAELALEDVKRKAT
jgi:hypothetical protein